MPIFTCSILRRHGVHLTKMNIQEIYVFTRIIGKITDVNPNNTLINLVNVHNGIATSRRQMNIKTVVQVVLCVCIAMVGRNAIITQKFTKHVNAKLKIAKMCIVQIIILLMNKEHQLDHFSKCSPDVVQQISQLLHMRRCYLIKDHSNQSLVVLRRHLSHQLRKISGLS